MVKALATVANNESLKWWGSSSVNKAKREELRIFHHSRTVIFKPHFIWYVLDLVDDEEAAQMLDYGVAGFNPIFLSGWSFPGEKR
ncbi:hypothetical protein E2542_SST20875 [Spatholobus suberectus]|nr:hypothetical protein E2542_SST20875 [Spatholobus suberectus]